MKKILLAIGMWLVAATGVYAQGVLPLALQQQSDLNGRPLAFAKLFTFVQGTVAQQQSTFQDSGLTVLNPWPLVADQSGRLPMFYMAAGSTHVQLTDATGVPVFDIQGMLVIGAAGGGGGGGGSVDPTALVATGDLKVRYGTGALLGYVRANGLTIGSATSGATERANNDTQNLFVYLYGTDPNLAVSGGRTGNALNDFNANKTIVLPDWRGRTIVALTDMGNTPSNVLTATFAGATTNVLGNAIGSQSQTLTPSQIPTITSGVNVSGSASVNAGGFVPVSASGSLGTEGVSPGSTGNAPVITAAANWSFPTSFAGTMSGSGSATSNNTGGAAHPIVMPGLLATVYMKL